MLGTSAGYGADIALPLQTGFPLPADIWEIAANETTESSPPVTIELAGTYDTASRSVKLSSIVCTYEALPTGTRISVVVTEDSLSVQSDAASGGEILQPVIRKLVNGPTGEPLAGEVIPKDVCLMKRYGFTLDRNWDVGNCAVVVVVHMKGDVLQADRVKISALTP